jgi:hypothetical protein
MGSWIRDLGIEEARIRVLYKLLHGLIIEDLRDLHIPGDVRTIMKKELEIKGWNRNGWLPIETGSVIESHRLGWGWQTGKIRAWFVRAETEEALGIDMNLIFKYLTETKLLIPEEFRCGCGASFELPKHKDPWLIRQSIQWSNNSDNDIHEYHSACLFVSPDAFNSQTYLLNRIKTNPINQFELFHQSRT